MKIYIVQGVHPTVPCNPMSAFMTREGAEKEANELANIILKDVGLKLISSDAKPAARDKALARALKKAEDYCDDAECDVWITELDVAEAPAPAEPREVKRDRVTYRSTRSTSGPDGVGTFSAASSRRGKFGPMPFNGTLILPNAHIDTLMSAIANTATTRKRKAGAKS
jgi:hypothetical protein